MSRYIPGHDHKLVPTPSTQYIGGTQGALECLTNRLENSVPNQMAIGVVDFLEAVDVDQDQAVGPIKKLDLLNRLVHLKVDVSPVCNSGQAIRIRQGFQLAGSLFQCPVRAIVAEYLDCAGDQSLFVPDRRDTHRDRNTVALLVAQGDMGLTLFAIGDGLAQRTAREAQQGATVIHVHQEIVEAVLADRFPCRIADRKSTR